MHSKNIILCGFMGCGKTYVGKALADSLNMQFVDMDELIEKKAGKTIPDIFAEQGESTFRDYEHDAAKELAEKTNLVIATGGGAMVQLRNSEVLKKTGTVVFLNPGFDACTERVKDSDRPLIKQNSLIDIKKIFDTREPIYKSVCDIEINGVKTTDEIIALVKSSFK